MFWSWQKNLIVLECSGHQLLSKRTDFRAVWSESFTSIYSNEWVCHDRGVLELCQTIMMELLQVQNRIINPALKAFQYKNFVISLL